MTVALSQTWAVKYRPRKFQQVIGQTDAVAVLSGLLKKARVPSAIMLVGPTGVGKTTLARVFARYLNCETNDACGKCSSCKHDLQHHPDISERNASGDTRGIDDIRALVQQAAYSPRYRFRVYIIDEGQGLTPQAQEALLKTLEEPPGRTVFVLCTTDPQKFKPAVVGRCQVLRLRPVPASLLERRLASIDEREASKIPTPAITAIARTARSVREAINALESAAAVVASDPKMTAQQVAAAVAADVNESDAATANRLLSAIYSGDVREIASAAVTVEEGLPTLNQMLWMNEYVIATLTQSRTRNAFPSADNRAFLAANRGAKLNTVLRAQALLFQARQTLHSVSVRDHTLLLAVLTAPFLKGQQ